MKASTVWCAVVACGLIYSHSTFGQDGGADAAARGAVLGPAGANVVIIAQAPAVQEELKLSEVQKTKVFDLSNDAGQKSQDLTRAAMLSGGNDPQGMMAAFLAFRQQNEKILRSILDTKQKERFDQITLRVEGPLGITREDVAARLKLSPQQYQQVQNLVDQWRFAQRRMVMMSQQGAAGGAFNPAAATNLRAQIASLRDEAIGRIGQVLSRTQKETFNSLLGQPFDIDRIDPSLARPQPSVPGVPAIPKSKSARSKRPAAKKKVDKGETPAAGEKP